MGPTASGKTAAAMYLADRLPVELISVDSAQVYRDMNIGTAKPDAETLARYPHRLIDLISPEESYSAARFRADALREMAEITARGKIPLLVGGTMLYFKALREGLADLPQADPEVRAEIDRLAETHGWPGVHAELAKYDPATAARLKPNDSQRLQRALEIVRLTGQPMQTLLDAGRDAPPPYRFLTIALVPSDRAVLHQRIADRYDAMLREGLEEEVRHLRNTYDLHLGLPSMRCVGYRQVWEMLEGVHDYDTQRDKGIAATRQLAKRQLTWTRSMTETDPTIRHIDCLKGDYMQQIDVALQESKSNGAMTHYSAPISGA